MLSMQLVNHQSDLFHILSFERKKKRLLNGKLSSVGMGKVNACEGVWFPTNFSRFQSKYLASGSNLILS